MELSEKTVVTTKYYILRNVTLKDPIRNEVIKQRTVVDNIHSLQNYKLKWQ